MCLGGASLSVTGFFAVDRAVLRGLAPEQVHALAQTDELELLCLHLYSLRNFGDVKDRFVGGRHPLAGDAAKEPSAVA